MPTPDTICQLLEDTPPGGCRTIRLDPSAPPVLSHSLSIRTSGRGHQLCATPWPDAEVCMMTFLAPEIHFQHPPLPEVLELFYVHSGRVGWNLDDGSALYLGPGDLTLHATHRCTDSAMMLPLGYAQGVSIALDLPRFLAELPPLLAESGYDPAVLRRGLATTLTLPASPALAAIFTPLYAIRPPRRLPWLRLRLLELLLYLEENDSAPPTPHYPSQQTERIREIHAFLISHLDERHTTDDLAARFAINTTTLKQVFKAVYGQPIHTYMREYRMREARRLLLESDASIADIAARVGYETQSKFTQTFKAVTGTLPRDVRKQGPQA